MASSMRDLDERVDARKRELIEELIEFKKSVHPGARGAVATLRDRLSDLTRIQSGTSERSGALEAWIAR